MCMEVHLQEVDAGCLTLLLTTLFVFKQFFLKSVYLCACVKRNRSVQGFLEARRGCGTELEVQGEMGS